MNRTEENNTSMMRTVRDLVVHIEEKIAAAPKLIAVLAREKGWTPELAKKQLDESIAHLEEEKALYQEYADDATMIQIVMGTAKRRT